MHNDIGKQCFIIELTFKNKINTRCLSMNNKDINSTFWIKINDAVKVVKRLVIKMM